MKFTNVELWNALRAKYKSFASITAEATADTFTEKGWGEISRNNIPALNQFFELSMRVAFNKMDIARVNTRLEESGLVEVYGGNNGGYLQRISVESIAPISPGFINLTNGDSIDPFIVRKPESKERFFECGNFNYQSLITIQEYQIKTIFLEKEHWLKIQPEDIGKKIAFTYEANEYGSAVVSGFQLQEYLLPKK